MRPLPEQATAAVLGFVRDRATAKLGIPPAQTVVSYPARWTEYQVECFDRAVATAGLGSVRRCSEAEAAAAIYAARNALPQGGRLAVYDLGGGFCEAAVLERGATGLRSLGGAEGGEHPSGADFATISQAVFQSVQPVGVINFQPPSLVPSGRVERSFIERSR